MAKTLDEVLEDMMKTNGKLNHSERAVKAFQVNEEIRELVQKINCKIEENEELLREYDFGMIIALWTVGAPSLFGVAGTKGVIRHGIMPFIYEQLEEDGINQY